MDNGDIAPEFIITREFAKYEPPKPCEDLVVVVRCKNCICRDTNYGRLINGEHIEIYCKLHRRYFNDDYFCANGVKRDEH